VKAWIRRVLLVVVLACLVWYLAAHWDELGALLRLTPVTVLALCGLHVVQTAATALVIRLLLVPLGVRAPWLEMYLLQHVTALLNYVPMRFGMLYRANYLKRRYGLGYARFGTLFASVAVLRCVLGTAFGVAVLAAVYGLGGRDQRILAVALGVTCAGFLGLALLPLPVPSGEGGVATALRNFLTGRRAMWSRPGLLCAAAALVTSNFLLSAVRLGIVYESMGRSLHPGGYAVLGGIEYAVLVLNVTPGALGIREFALGATAVVFGFSMATGVMAAAIDRAVVIGYTFAGGAACALVLRRGEGARPGPADAEET
jgi:uncharacterized membrane protein YbhN (UPF0104 family)